MNIISVSEVTLNGKVYLGKLSSLPRHKIKDYFKENNVSKTSRLDQSQLDDFLQSLIHFEFSVA